MGLGDFFIAVAVASFICAAVLVVVVIRQWRKVHRRIEAAHVERIEPAIDLDHARMFRMIARNICPDCKGFGFYGGPRGGLSQHIYCANVKCRSAFNVTQFTITDGSVNRIEKKSEEWYHGE